MTLAVPTAAAALLAGGTLGECWLVELDFTSGTLRFSTWSSSILWGGNTYTALGHLLGISEIKESEDPAAEKINLTVPITSAAMLAATLGNVESYRGRKARIYLMVLDANHQPVAAPVRRFTGTMGPVQISRDRPALEGGTRGGKITLPLTRLGLARARNSDGIRRTHQQQQAIAPGDTGLANTVNLIEKPAVWASLAFQAAGL